MGADGRWFAKGLSICDPQGSGTGLPSPVHLVLGLVMDYTEFPLLRGCCASGNLVGASVICADSSGLIFFVIWQFHQNEKELLRQGDWLLPT